MVKLKVKFTKSDKNKKYHYLYKNGVLNIKLGK